jgi:hypothetical protein
MARFATDGDECGDRADRADEIASFFDYESN